MHGFFADRVLRVIDSERIIKVLYDAVSDATERCIMWIYSL